MKFIKSIRFYSIKKLSTYSYTSDATSSATGRRVSPSLAPYGSRIIS